MFQKKRFGQDCDEIVHSSDEMSVSLKILCVFSQKTCNKSNRNNFVSYIQKS
jgi:hypothetical protein